ncbi:MAG: hypothetical protein IJX43_02485 [Alphaproteobacteria bacterium]|nr:hypothetical protein [Alphaproteobacteria bacterium]
MPNLIVGLGLVVSMTRNATAVPSCLMTTQRFVAGNCTAGTYCCPNGDTETTYSCPDGWTYNLATSLCTRSDTSTGSDSTGSYTISYTSCAATETTEDCCDVGFQSVGGDDGGLQTRCVPCPNTGGTL